VFSFAGIPNKDLLQSLGGFDSPLFKKHGLYMDHVTVANLPENYQDRIVEMFPGTYRRIQLYTLDAYDLALSKIDRNSEKDREDVKYLVRNVPLDLHVLKKRYESELRPGFIGNIDWTDKTMKFWMEEFAEDGTT